MKYQLFAITLMGFVSLQAYSESNRRDYDVDNDGLIEIKDLDDLHAIGFSNGQSLYGQNNGCILTDDFPPKSECLGFELIRDLDFDTNQNGKFDKDDAFWNGGAGWEPIALWRTLFEGNGFAIRNLTINQPTKSQQGLFTYISESSVRNLVLIGASIKALDTSGVIAGLLDSSNIHWVLVTGDVSGVNESRALGGLIGISNGSHITHAFTSVSVSAHHSSGAVVGRSEGYAHITNVLAVGKVSLVVGDSVGFGGEGKGYFHNSYMATDVSDLPYDNLDEENGSFGFTLFELKCFPTSIFDSDCESEGPMSIYERWSEYSEYNNNNYWDFGTEQQLPGMVLNFKLNRIDVNLD